MLPLFFGPCKSLIIYSVWYQASTIQVADGKPPARIYPSSFPKTLGIIYREEGLAVLFSGVVPRTIWISLGGAVFLGVYEAVKKNLASEEEIRLVRRD